MRTAILVGLTFVADAIRKDWMQTSYKFFMIMLFLCTVMDIGEWIKRITKKN